MSRFMVACCIQDCHYTARVENPFCSIHLAAPDLLAALKDALFQIESGRKVSTGMMIRAIAKAEGKEA